MIWNRATLLLVFAALALIAMAFVAPRLARSPAPCQVGTIAHPDITECSGIVASRRYSGVFWTHNDRGNAPAIYAITGEGETIAEFRIAARNEDWEDIAIDDEGHLYIGQIGNNDLTRPTARVFQIDEPNPAHGATRSRPRLKVTRTWHLAYPGQPFNSESLFIHRGYGYMISKVNRKQPAALYRFPLESHDDPIVLERIAGLPIRSPVTGADLSADGAHLAVISQAGLDVFHVNGNLAAIASAPRRHLPLNPSHHIEACCFTPTGVLAAAESREIYLFPAMRGE